MMEWSPEGGWFSRERLHGFPRENHPPSGINSIMFPLSDVIFVLLYPVNLPVFLISVYLPIWLKYNVNKIQLDVPLCPPGIQQHC